MVNSNLILHPTKHTCSGGESRTPNQTPFGADRFAGPSPWFPGTHPFARGRGRPVADGHHRATLLTGRARATGPGPGEPRPRHPRCRLSVCPHAGARGMGARNGPYEVPTKLPPPGPFQVEAQCLTTNGPKHSNYSPPRTTSESCVCTAHPRNPPPSSEPPAVPGYRRV